MKKIDFTSVAQSIKPEHWVFFAGDPILSKYENPIDKVKQFVIAVVGQKPAKTLETMRKGAKALEQWETLKEVDEISDESLTFIKDAFVEIAPNFMQRASPVILPIADWLEATNT